MDNPFILMLDPGYNARPKLINPGLDVIPQVADLFTESIVPGGRSGFIIYHGSAVNDPVGVDLPEKIIVGVFKKS